jgi:hypothetical protein
MGALPNTRELVYVEITRGLKVLCKAIVIVNSKQKLYIKKSSFTKYVKGRWYT